MQAAPTPESIKQPYNIRFHRTPAHIFFALWGILCVLNHFDTWDVLVSCPWISGGVGTYMTAGRQRIWFSTNTSPEAQFYASCCTPRCAQTQPRADRPGARGMAHLQKAARCCKMLQVWNSMKPNTAELLSCRCQEWPESGTAIQQLTKGSAWNMLTNDEESSTVQLAGIAHVMLWPMCRHASTSH